MPKLNKQGSNAPKNAKTDTGTSGKKTSRPTSRSATKTNDGKGVTKKEALGVGERVSGGSPSSAGQTYGYTSHYINPETSENYYPGQFFPLGASGGKSGSIGKETNAFLKGFNADLGGANRKKKK